MQRDGIEIGANDIEETQARPAPPEERPSGGDRADRAAEALLVAQAQQDSNAFGVLYERYIDRIYSYIYNRVHSVQDAEDLTARTFYRALDRLHTYEDRGLPFAAWLYRIAHNLVANWRRDQKRRTFVSLEGLHLPIGRREEPDVVVEKAEEHEALWQAIERLPAERRDLLIYKFGNRLTNLEIGALMDKSEGAIKSLYFRTLAALRKDLGQRNGWKEGQSDEKQSKQ